MDFNPDYSSSGYNYRDTPLIMLKGHRKKADEAADQETENATEE